LFPWAPEYTFNIGAQYEFNLGNNMVLTLRVTYAWMDEVTVAATDRVVAGVPIDRIFDHEMVNTTLTLVAGAWNAQLYVTNLNEEEYIRAMSGAPGHPDAYANDPRLYGIRLTYDFGKQ
jgi:iron complex outermembrane receptor protein